MNILAIDSTTDMLLVCAEINGKYAQKIGDKDAKKHNGLVLSFVDEVLGMLSASVEDIDVFSAVCGPGSFTGIRIGISTVKAFCLALGKKAVAVDSLELIGYGQMGDFATAIDARNDNYYAALFDGNYQNMVWEKSVTKDELLSYNVKVIYQTLPVSGEDIISIAKTKAQNGQFESNISPRYLKKSQAERMKDGE